MNRAKTVNLEDSKTFSPETRAHALVEALPYIQKFAGTVVLVKMGGNALIDEDLFNRFAEDIVLLRSVGIMPVVVHGGGPQIGNHLQEIGKESVFIDGLRVTDSETLTAVREVLVHQVGKRIVDTINSYGGIAVGISGEDDDLLIATAKDKQLGFVGEVTEVKPEIIFELLNKGKIPVISTIAVDKEGQAYNINADTAAGAIAGALNAEKAVYLSDVPGLLKDKTDSSSIISEVEFQELDKMIKEGIISEGMIPKVKSCMHALNRGAKTAHLLDGRVPHVLLLELFTDSGIGTMIMKGESDD
jgi:acetylglutamate kinase